MQGDTDEPTLEISEYNSRSSLITDDIYDDKGCWYRCVERINNVWESSESEDLKKNKEKYMKTSMRQLIIYLVFLSLIMFIAFATSIPQAYLFNSAIRDSLLKTPASNGMTMENVETLNDIWDVLRGPFLDVTHPEKWYNDLPLSANEKNTIALSSKILGKVRLRQVRMNSNSCVVNEMFKSQIFKCYAPYSYLKESQLPFGLKNGTEWTFTRSSKLKAGFYISSTTIYNGGGYYTDLPLDHDGAKKKLDNLFENLWIDKGTRAVFFTFPAYNANLNLFAYVNVVFELPVTGGVVTQMDIRVVKLLRYENPLDFAVLGAEICFIFFVLFYAIGEVIEMSKKKWQYFTNFWSWMDIAIVSMSITCCAVNIHRTISVRTIISKLITDSNVYANFESLTYWQIQFNNLLAITLLLSWLKIFKYVNFNKTMNELVITIGESMKDLGPLTVMFLIVFFAFVQMGYLSFGSQMSEMQSFAHSALTLMKAAFGDSDISSFVAANRVLGPIFFVVFIFIVFFIIINMFIAIITEVFIAVKEESLNKKSDFTITEFVKKKFKRAKNLFKNKQAKVEFMRNVISDGVKENRTFSDIRETLLKNGFKEEEVEAAMRRYKSDNFEEVDEKIKNEIKLEEEKMRIVEEYSGKNLTDEEIQASLLRVTKLGGKAEKSEAAIRLETLMLINKVDKFESYISNILTKMTFLFNKIRSFEDEKDLKRKQLFDTFDKLK